MFLKEKIGFMFKYVFVVLLFPLLMSCEDEAPTSAFIPESFLKNTLDKLVAKVDGENFFYDNDPTATLITVSGVSSILIEYTSSENSQLSLTIPIFIEADKEYIINEEFLSGDAFEGKFLDANGNVYETIFRGIDDENNSEGTIDLDVDNRMLNGSFSFTAKLTSASGGSTRQEVEITTGNITDLTY